MNLKRINILLDILQEKYPKVYKHSERVAMLCYAFSKKFEIELREREVVYFAGFLHEIGKVSFDDEIEINGTIYDINNVYPLFSKSVLVALDEDRLAKIIEQHMENLDGSGSPYRLNVKNIHLFATMLRICDFYDHCRMNGDSHTVAATKMRKQADVIFPKKMITPFIKMIVNDEDMDLWS